MFETFESRWRAVQSRDPTAINFVYAVLTTRIYCRPTCHARLPRRANISFYNTGSEAVAAGFRACKRCKPEQQRAESEELAQERAVRKACEIIEKAAGMMTLKEIAAHVGLSPRYFHGAFKKVTGLTPGVYARRARKPPAAKFDDGNRKTIHPEGTPSKTPSLCIADESSGNVTPLTEFANDSNVPFVLSEAELFDPYLPSNAIYGYDDALWDFTDPSLSTWTAWLAPQPDYSADISYLQDDFTTNDITVMEPFQTKQRWNLGLTDNFAI